MTTRFIKYFLLAICLFPIVTIGQRNIQSFSGPKSNSLANIKSTLDKEDAVIHNFSQISFSRYNSHYLLGGEQRYNLKELSNIFIGLQKKISKHGSFGLSVSKYGFKDYSESKYSLGYSRKLSHDLSLSLHFDLNTLKIANYGMKNNIAFGLGLTWVGSENLIYSFQLYNMEKMNVALNSESRGFIRIGLRCHVSKMSVVHYELEKFIDESITFKIGFEYNIFDLLSIRSGFNTNPGVLAFGFAYKGRKGITIEGGSQYNLQLGVISSVAFKYSYE